MPRTSFRRIRWLHLSACLRILPGVHLLFLRLVRLGCISFVFDSRLLGDDGLSTGASFLPCLMCRNSACLTDRRSLGMYMMPLCGVEERRGMER